MIQFTQEENNAIDELAMRFFDSSYGMQAASNQLRALIKSLKAAEERYEERLRVARKGGRDVG
jgi:hypothetical protein